MTSLTEFFNNHEEDALKGISHKNNIIKRNIIAHMAVNGECTLSELTKELHISVPTITKLVQELVDENIVSDLGKVETPGGRRPNIFGLASSAIYFAGVNVGRDNMNLSDYRPAEQHHQGGERQHVRTVRPTAVHGTYLHEHRTFHFDLRHRPRQDSRVGCLHDGTCQS